jgi:hypothetical protein
MNAPMYNSLHKVMTGKLAVEGRLNHFVGCCSLSISFQSSHTPGNNIEPLLCETGVSGQDIRALLRSGEWSICRSPKQQVVLFHDFAHIECCVMPSVAQIRKVVRIKVE